MCEHCRTHPPTERFFSEEARPEMLVSELLTAPLAQPDVHVHVTVPPSDQPDPAPIQVFPTINIPGLLEFLQGHLLLERRVEILEARISELGM